MAKIKWLEHIESLTDKIKTLEFYLAEIKQKDGTLAQDLHASLSSEKDHILGILDNLHLSWDFDKMHRCIDNALVEARRFLNT
jgi:hypothetical protein